MQVISGPNDHFHLLLRSSCPTRPHFNTSHVQRWQPLSEIRSWRAAIVCHATSALFIRGSCTCQPNGKAPPCVPLRRQLWSCHVRTTSSRLHVTHPMHDASLRFWFYTMIGLSRVREEQGIGIGLGLYGDLKSNRKLVSEALE